MTDHFIDKLDLKHFVVQDEGSSLYRVYSDESNYVQISAASAKEAAEKSAVKCPYKILPYNPKVKLVFNSTDLVHEEPKISSTSS